MAKILIVDDEPRIRELIHEHLQYSGYICEEAGDGSAALAQLSGGGFDLVILDLMMPFMDGMTCLREMRARHINTPVIILTARGEEYDKLAGLESGADDYVVKPFSPRELVARVRAVLNRTMPRTPETADTMTFGELTIDTASHTVRVSGEEVALTPKEFDLLVFLASNKGIALSREKNVYIANMVKCRPPKNRDPKPEEQEACLHWLREQFKIIRPRLVICVGRIAAQRLIDKDFRVTRQHGEFIDKNGTLFMGTYHPAAILRNPNNKEAAFGDWLKVRDKIEELHLKQYTF